MKIHFKKPEVSIIIVNYNNAKFLGKSITSAISQNYKNKEIILVDDNSTDNSMEIIKKFKNKIILLQSKKRTKEGSYNQINCYYHGVVKSKGKYIFFLDSDDYFTKNKVKHVVSEFKKKSKINAIFDLPIWLYKKKIIKKQFVQKKFVFSSWPRFSPQSCIAVRRKFALDFFKIIKLNKFEALWFDFRLASYTFLKTGEIYILKKYLTYYRQLDNSASKKYKILSKNWWYRRNQAHEFIIFLRTKLKLKNKITLDRLLTKIMSYL